MPTPYIEKLAKEGKGSVKELEDKWDKAKKLAADQGHKEDFDYITGIFKRMAKANTTSNADADETQSAFMGVDMTLFIRLLEIAREDLKSDAELHRLAERCSQLYAQKKQPLTMYDYEDIVSVLTRTNEPEYSEVKAKTLPLKALGRLAATSPQLEVSGTIRDAVVAIKKIFERNSLDWKLSLKKGDTWTDAHINVKGTTAAGKVDFDFYLDANKKDLLIDWWDPVGLFDFNSAVQKELDKAKFKFGAGTSVRELQKLEKDYDKLSSVQSKVSGVITDVIQSYDNFLISLYEISYLMSHNAVSK